MTAEEKKQYKAKQLRYKRPIASCMNLDYIREQIWNMSDLIQDVQWFMSDEDNLVNAMDGDEDEAYEFKMAFSDLAEKVSDYYERRWYRITGETLMRPWRDEDE